MTPIRLAAALCLILSGCTATPVSDDKALNDAARQAAQNRLDAYIAAALGDSVAQLPDYWTTAAKVYEPELFVDGRDAMMAMVSEVMKSMKFASATLKVTDAYGHDRGTVVYQYGSIDQTLATRDGKTPPSRLRMHLTIRWVKEADGVWRIDRFMETPMPPVTAPGA